MTRYSTFLIVFIIATISIVCFLFFYIEGFMLLIQRNPDGFSHNADPFFIFQTVFSPKVIIFGIIAVMSTLVNKLLGIIAVAKSNSIADSEKVFWIIGFALMTFVTAIIFLILSKNKKLLY